MSANAESEIAPFKLENFAADFSVRYSLDDRTTNADFVRSILWREELGFHTRSYVYHPALLDMNISGGLVFLQDQPIHQTQLIERLGSRLSARQEDTVFLKGDREVSYGRIMEVLDLLKSGRFRVHQKSKWR